MTSLIRATPEAREHLLAHPELGQKLADGVALLDAALYLAKPTPGELFAKAIHVEAAARLGLRDGVVPTQHIKLDSAALFTQRPSRAGLSRVTRWEGPKCASVVIIAGPNDEGTHDLWTAYIGHEVAPREPWDSSLTTAAERRESVEWWLHHALSMPDLDKNAEIVTTPRKAGWPDLTPRPRETAI